MAMREESGCLSGELRARTEPRETEAAIDPACNADYSVCMDTTNTEGGAGQGNEARILDEITKSAPGIEARWARNGEKFAKRDREVRDASERQSSRIEEGIINCAAALGMEASTKGEAEAIAKNAAKAIDDASKMHHLDREEVLGNKLVDMYSKAMDSIPGDRHEA